MSALSPRQFMAHMTPEELLPHAIDRTSHPSDKRNVDEIAASMQKIGYQTRKHNGMSGDVHHYPPSMPITLVHSDLGSSLWDGNHRVHAALQAGVEKLPVRVHDYRTRTKP